MSVDNRQNSQADGQSVFAKKQSDDRDYIPNANLLQHTTELAMHIISAYVHPGDTVIDATCGNGHDTLRLARMRPAWVFAFDIQPAAVDATRRRLLEAGFAPASGHGPASGPDSASADASLDSSSNPEAPHIVITCLGHERIREFFRSRETGEPGFASGISAIVFNLGYLPGGDKSITTRTDTTLAAVRECLPLLRAGGLLCVTMYSGHPEGADEKQALLTFAEGLDSKLWHVGYVSMLNQRSCPPEILLITRKR